MRFIRHWLSSETTRSSSGFVVPQILARMTKPTSPPWPLHRLVHRSHIRESGACAETVGYRCPSAFDIWSVVVLTDSNVEAGTLSLQVLADHGYGLSSAVIFVQFPTCTSYLHCLDVPVRKKGTRYVQHLRLRYTASENKHDIVRLTVQKFFGYIADIAPVTYKNEPDCIGYAWFRSTEDNKTIPLHWCRGFEV